MTPAKKAQKGAKQPAAAGRIDPEVTAFLRALAHPLAAEIELVRRALLDADPAIREGIKWNAPSFRTSEYFATVNLRSRERLQLVLHLGAKSKDGTKELAIPDPAGLLEWRSSDRALATLGTPAEVPGRLPAFAALVREWLRWV